MAGPATRMIVWELNKIQDLLFCDVMYYFFWLGDIKPTHAATVSVLILTQP
jgi:hypothetical protein